MSGAGMAADRGLFSSLGWGMVGLYDLLKHKAFTMPMGNSHPHPAITVLAALFFSTLAHAELTEQEAIQAQLASALASADYAERNCPDLRINTDRIAELQTQSGMSLEDLKASEDYIEQRDVILSVVQDQPKSLVCALLVQAHGGYGRGIITQK